MDFFSLRKLKRLFELFGDVSSQSIAFLVVTFLLDGKVEIENEILELVPSCLQTMLPGRQRLDWVYYISRLRQTLLHAYDWVAA